MRKPLIHREKMDKWLAGSAYTVSCTSSLSKSACCSGAGFASIVAGGASPRRTVLRVRVPVAAIVSAIRGEQAIGIAQSACIYDPKQLLRGTGLLYCTVGAMPSFLRFPGLHF